MNKKKFYRNLICSSALSTLLAAASGLPVYAAEDSAESLPIMETETKKKPVKARTGTETVKIVLVNDKTGKTAAVIEGAAEDGIIKVSTLKMPSGIQAADPDAEIKLKDNEVPQIRVNSTNKETGLSLVFLEDGKEIGRQEITQQVKNGKTVSFVQGVNFEIPQGYTLSEKQDEQTEKLLKNGTVRVDYGTSVSLNLNLVKAAAAEIEFMNGKEKVGSILVSQSVESSTPDSDGKIDLDLSRVSAPLNYSLVQPLTDIKVQPGTVEKVTAEVREKLPAAESDSTKRYSAGLKIEYVDENSKPVGSDQSETIALASKKENYQITESMLKVPSGYHLTQSDLPLAALENGKTAEVKISVESDRTDLSSQTDGKETGDATRNQDNATGDNGSGLNEGSSLQQSQPDSGKQNDNPEDPASGAADMNHPNQSGEENGQTESSKRGQETGSGTESSGTSDGSEPSEEQPASEAVIRITYETADGTVIDTQNEKTVLTDGETSAAVDQSSLKVPEGYRIVSEIPDMVFEAGKTNSYVITVEKTEPESETQEAGVEYIYQDLFTGKEIARSEAVLQIPAGEQDAVFKESTLKIPAGYCLNSPFEDITVKAGEKKTVELKVAKSAAVRVTFTDGGQPVGSSPVYFFEQTSADQTNASLKASDLSLPAGYELDEDEAAVYDIPLGTGQTIEISVPVRAADISSTAFAELKIQYYIQNGSQREIVATQTLKSDAAGNTGESYVFDFEGKLRLEVPKGYHLKQDPGLGRIRIQYGKTGTIELEVLRASVHTSTETGWLPYALAAAAAAVLFAAIWLLSRRKNSKNR